MKLSSGEVTCAGYQAKPQEPPSDLLLSPPPLPQLNLCTVQGGALVVPPSQVSVWGTHAQFGPEFQKKVKEIVDEFGEPQPESSGAAAGAAESTVQQNKPKPPPPPMEKINVSELSDSKLAQVPVSGLKRELVGKIQIRVGLDGSWHILNTGDSVLTVPAGSVIAGFGPGAFKHIPRSTDGKPGMKPTDENLVLFDLDSSDSYVLFSGRLLTVGEAVATAQTSRAQTDVTYFTKKVSEGGSGFQLERKHEVYYKCTPKVTGSHDPTSGGSDPSNIDLKNSGSLAAVTSSVNFQKGHCSVIWSVKWATKGLTPIKPQIVLLHSMEIPGQTAVKL